ncbi:MAG: lysine--tRNA ligase [Nanoarchaeota archaeon]|nr:lysine--tRNA ligase [Nanoarchaeota archaeon]
MSKEDSQEDQSVHWTDVAAERVIQEKGDKKTYTVAAGITPSGTVHIGNFREIITVELVKRALEKRGKKVRFIYSWDDFDVFRKVPANMPKPEILREYLRKPIVDTPDTFGCHKSYAEHHEKEVEETVPQVGITPECLYQAKKYRSGEYAKELKQALENTETIIKILNQYREEPLEKGWLPVALFCEQCGKDTINTLAWPGKYTLSYECECGHKDTFDFKKKPTLTKLKWRVDWPMRWAYEQVDFEPGGKDHSTVGGSYDTGKQICKQVWNVDAPSYIMYDFISLKGMDGKMSSSKGEVITLKDVLEVYEPEITRYLFAGTRPNREFAISFDADVLNVYEEFDKAERVYFGVEELHDEKKAEKYKIAYELSYIGKLPKTIPYQPKFRHLTLLLQIHNLKIDKVVSYFEKELKNDHDKKRLRTRAECAKNWLQKHAPEEFKFTVQEKIQVKVSKEEKKMLHELATKLSGRKWTDTELHEEMYILCKNHDILPKDFFTLAYRVLINKERGPRLASFILEIGKEKAAKLFMQV